MDRYQRVIQDVTSIVDSMGGFDEETGLYTINPETVECVKELIRVLRKDGSLFPILRHLGALNIVERDLIPIVKEHCPKEEELFEFIIRLFVSLTYPALVFFREKMPDNADHKRVFLQINGYLRSYKSILSRDVKFWKILCEKALFIAAKNTIDQSEEEKLLLERILILIRNILHVPIDTFLERGADDDEMVSENMIMTLKDSGILGAIIQMTSNPEAQRFCFHLLEIITSLLREQSPEFLTLDDNRNDHVNKKRKTCAKVESMELEEMKEQEKRLKNMARLSRFNRFKDSTYLVKNVKAVGANDLIYHKTIEDPRKISLDLEKNSNRKPKNRAPMQDDCSIRFNKMGITYRRPSTKVRKILKEFCEEFLKESYSSLMAYVKSSLENRSAQEHDETYYFFAANFFMEFNRHSKGDPATIEETFNFEYFHYLHTNVDNYLDQIAGARADRGAIKAWSRRLHVALKAYKELLFTIASMKHVQEERMLYLAKDMSDKVFYELDYRELLLNLICGYEEKKMSPQFLRDLIETNHVFLKMLELYSKSVENFVVKIKKNKRKKPTKKIKKEEQIKLVEKLWQEMVFELDDAIQGNVQLPNSDDEIEVLAFNLLSEKTREEQRDDALYRISKFLKQKKILFALALCRNARDEYNDYDDAPFGDPDLSPEEEVAILHKIIGTEKWIFLDMEEYIEKNSQANAGEKKNNSNKEKNKKQNNEEIGAEKEGSEENTDENEANRENQNDPEVIDKEIEPGSDYDEEKEPESNAIVHSESAYKEKKFFLQDFVLKYCNTKVVKAYGLALKRFETNSEILNHAIIRMGHRIAMEAKCPVFFFQLSLFRIFQRCFAASRLDRNNKFSEIRSFARYIIKEFIIRTSANDKLLVEILFWKNKKEMREIEDNYDKPEPSEPRKRKGKKKGGKKTKDGTIESDEESNRSDDDRPGNIGNLSDESTDFTPQFKSTQIVRESSEPQPSNTETINDNNDKDDNDDIDLKIQGLIGEPTSPNAYDFEDDDLLDIDDVLNQVAADEDEETLANDVDKENSIIPPTQDDLGDISDADTIDGEVIISKKKKNVVLDDSDDD